MYLIGKYWEIESVSIYRHTARNSGKDPIRKCCYCLEFEDLAEFLLSREINHGRVSSIEVDKISMRLLTPSGPSRGFVGPNLQQARPFSL